LVVLAVAWLVLGHPTRADVLIAVPPEETESWVNRLRLWLGRHIEVYWAYPWILLAPYVLWFGAKVPVERQGLAWRVAAHALVGAGFITGSQALTRRIEVRHPRMVLVRLETLVRIAPADGSTNAPNVAPTNRLYVRSMEWTERSDSPRSMEILSPGATRLQLGMQGAPAPLDGGESVIVDQEVEELIAGVPSSDIPFARPNPGAAAAGSPGDVPGYRFMVRDHFARPQAMMVALHGFVYLALVGLGQSVQFRRRLNERERQAEKLEARLTESRLHALQAQLRPHFLFNALNGVAALVRSDPRVAEEMVANLSDMLRFTLANDGRQEISLREELSFVERYLALQQMRFGDRLTVELQVDPATLDCLIPSLLVHPLVENAVLHGIEPFSGPGLIRVETRPTRGRLEIIVEDNGCGLEAARPTTRSSGTGIGLRSVRERLAALYGAEQEVGLQARPEGGTVAVVAVPIRKVPGQKPDNHPEVSS